MRVHSIKEEVPRVLTRWLQTALKRCKGPLTLVSVIMSLHKDRRYRQPVVRVMGC